jgi:hypothetical protein
MKNATQDNNDFEAIGSSLGFNSLGAFAFLSLYLFLQHRFPQIYAPKKDGEGTTFASRLKTSIFENENILLRKIGLDAYVLVRYCRLCARFCLFGSFVGFVVLFPTYGTADGDATDVFRYSASNLIDMGTSFSHEHTNTHAHNNNNNNTGTDDNTSQATQFGGVRIWIVIIVTWVITLWFLYDMNIEYKLFVKLRQEYLMNAKNDQSRHSILVENIPVELRRSDKALRLFFETMFPGQIHSACVCLRLDDLHDLIEKRDSTSMSKEEEIENLNREIDRIRKLHMDRLTSIRKKESRDESRGRRGPLSDVIGRVVQSTDSLAFGEKETKLDVSSTKLDDNYESESDASSPLLVHDLESEEELREVTPYVRMGDEENKSTKTTSWCESILNACWGCLVFTGEDVVGRSAATLVHRAAVGVESVVTISEELVLSSANCSTGFVTFKRLQDANVAAQILLVPSAAESLKSTLAPQRGDIIWRNVAIPRSQIQTRTMTMEILLGLCVCISMLKCENIAFLSLSLSLSLSTHTHTRTR